MSEGNRFNRNLGFSDGEVFLPVRPEASPFNRNLGIESPGFLESLGGGLVTGARRIPIVGAVVEEMADQLGMDVRDLDELATRIQSTPTGQISSLVAEFLPQLLGGVAAFSGGRVAATGLLRGLAGRQPQVARAMALGTRGEQIGALAEGGQLAQIAGRALPRVEALGGQLPKTTPFIPKPLLERGGEILGGSAGFGTFEGARLLAQGEPIPEAAKGAAIAAAFGVGIETGFFALGRAPSLLRARGGLLGGRGRDFDPVKAQAKARDTPEVAALDAREIERLQTKVLRAENRVQRQLLNVEEMDAELAAAFSAPGQGGAAGAKLLDKSQALLERVEKSRAVVKRREGQLQFWQDFLNNDAVQIAMRSPGPMNPGSPHFANFREQLNKLALQWTKTIQGGLEDLGPSATQFGGELRTVVTDTMLRQAITVSNVSRMAEEAAAINGTPILGTVLQKSPTKFLNNVVSAYQEGGLPKLASRPQLDRFTPVFTQVEDVLKGIRQSLEDIGVPNLPTMKELRGRAFMVLDRNQSARAIRKTLEDALKKTPDPNSKTGQMYTPERAEQIAEAISTGRPGIGQLADTTLHEVFADKTISGLLAQKVPIIEDPMAAFRFFLNGQHMRISMGRFGPDATSHRQFADRLVSRISAEGGNLPAARTIVDAVFGFKYGDVGLQRMAQSVTNLQVGTKMPWGFVANMSQAASILAFNGMRDSGRAFLDMFRGTVVRKLPGGKFLAPKVTKTEEILEGMSIMETVFQTRREGFLNPGASTPSARFANFILSGTGFTFIEKFNRLFAAVASQYTMGRLLTKGIAGKLRGNNFDRSMRMFRGMDLDLDDLIRQGRDEMVVSGVSPGDAAVSVLKREVPGAGQVTVGARQASLFNPAGQGGGHFTYLDRGTFAGMQQTQFAPDLTRKPTMWNTPWGRVAFQFKTFALSHMRFMRDHVVAEAALGNLRPLAYILSVYPIAGEAVTDIRQVLKTGELDRDEDGVARIINNMLAVGGMGLATDLLTASRFGGEGILKLVVGPSATDMATAIAALGSLDMELARDRVTRQPIWQMGTQGFKLGVGLSGAALDGLEDITGGGAPANAATLDELMRRSQ